MANNYFKFKQFTIHQDRCAMKVTTDACLFGAWTAEKVRAVSLESREVQEGGFTSVMDIGTGTGLLALMLAQANHDTYIDAIEIDQDTFEQANENIAASPWPDRIHPVHCDAKAMDGSRQYDIIISNPPFYEKELRSGNSQKNKAHHDESLLIDDVLTIIQRNLKPRGRFYLLLPYKRNEETEAVITKNDLTISHKTFVKQSTQHDYFRVMLSGVHRPEKKQRVVASEIAITNPKKEYTMEFTNLLKNFYLYL